ncbi:MAG: SHD1 domain-containing protein [Verrucomicrobiota bacterium]
MEAELVSHKAGKITLLRADGVKFEVAPNVFSADDQLFIKEWMEKNPETVSYAFRISADKEKTEGRTQDLGYKRVKNEKWAFRMKITNTSRDTVNNLKVKYRMFYTNEADGEYSASDLAPLKMAEGEASLKADLAFNRTMEFLTKTVNLDFVDYDGAGSRYKDTLEGCLVRIEDANGKVVAEWKNEANRMREKTWDNTSPRKENSGGAVIVN